MPNLSTTTVSSSYFIDFSVVFVLLFLSTFTFYLFIYFFLIVYLRLFLLYNVICFSSAVVCFLLSTDLVDYKSTEVILFLPEIRSADASILSNFCNALFVFSMYNIVSLYRLYCHYNMVKIRPDFMVTVYRLSFYRNAFCHYIVPNDFCCFLFMYSLYYFLGCPSLCREKKNFGNIIFIVNHCKVLRKKKKKHLLEFYITSNKETIHG